jgi:hypothetical protein
MRQPRTRASRPRLFLVVAATSVITLAASSPISSAVNGHVVGHTSASPLTAVATADCSIATATEIVLRLHLNDPEVAANPVARVLCGSFTGPGSPNDGRVTPGTREQRLINWVVFRWIGDAWQFVMKQPAAASITAAGSDIRQTLPVYRPSDSRCCPTGGTKDAHLALGRHTLPRRTVEPGHLRKECCLSLTDPGHRVRDRRQRPQQLRKLLDLQASAKSDVTRHRTAYRVPRQRSPLQAREHW